MGRVHVRIDNKGAASQIAGDGRVVRVKHVKIHLNDDKGEGIDSRIILAVGCEAHKRSPLAK